MSIEFAPYVQPALTSNKVSGETLRTVFLTDLMRVRRRALFSGISADFFPGCLAIGAVVPAHAFAARPKEGHPMSDPDSLRESADKAYGVWNATGAWVAAHPKTAIVAALVVIAVVIWLAF